MCCGGGLGICRNGQATAAHGMFAASVSLEPHPRQQGYPSGGAGRRYPHDTGCTEVPPVPWAPTSTVPVTHAVPALVVLTSWPRLTVRANQRLDRGSESKYLNVKARGQCLSVGTTFSKGHCAARHRRTLTVMESKADDREAISQLRCRHNSASLLEQTRSRI